MSKVMMFLSALLLSQVAAAKTQFILCKNPTEQIAISIGSFWNDDRNTAVNRNAGQLPKETKVSIKTQWVQSPSDRAENLSAGWNADPLNSEQRLLTISNSAGEPIRLVLIPKAVLGRNVLPFQAQVISNLEMGMANITLTASTCSSQVTF